MHLVVSTNTKDVSSLLAAETQRVHELLADGTLKNCWVKSDFSGGVLILDCATETEATATLNTMPTVKNNATNYTLTEITDLP